MTLPRLASLLTLLCASALPLPALAGGATVIPGIGGSDADAAPAPHGRYGGGLIEFMMTGMSHDPAPMRAAPASRAYMATTAPREPEPDYGFEPAAQAPVPGYETPHKVVDPQYVRQEVPFEGHQGAGTILIDTTNKFLFLVEGGGRALRYGIGVGRPGFIWSGEKTISRKAEWPDWTPPGEMLLRRPDLPHHMEGGIANPLGARAMYLGSSLYRIHGTNEPDTIGTNVSSGCIRLTNDDVADLYSRVKIGTHVIVM